MKIKTVHLLLLLFLTIFASFHLSGDDGDYEYEKKYCGKITKIVKSSKKVYVKSYGVKVNIGDNVYIFIGSKKIELKVAMPMETFFICKSLTSDLKYFRKGQGVYTLSKKLVKRKPDAFRLTYPDSSDYNNGKIDGRDIVTDEKTHLSWSKCAEGLTGKKCEGAIKYYTMQDAVNLCEKLNVNSQYHWRLPTVKELSTIIDYRRRSPSYNYRYFPDKVDSKFWSSSSSSQYKNYGWVVDFFRGEIKEEPVNRSFYVRCVATPKGDEK